ncbi:restriction endonuclease subunit S [Romboutsia hominis]|uniref:restriction endonuclease subunit S n=1 Tax=Romboutsia hominis TaxID=1507512 RepID=UPI000A6CF762|nr:restriction endonuclease subunit S [Romboutsia hominis]
MSKKLPQGWKRAKLGDICDFSQGVQVAVDKQHNKREKNHVRFLRIIDYTQNKDEVRYIEYPGDKYMVNSSEVIMIRYGDAGRVVRGYEGAIANNLFKITPKFNDLTNDYLYYFISQKRIYDRLINSQQKTGLPAVNFRTVSDIEILYPESLEEQERIVSILEKAEDAICKREESNRLLDEYLKSVFVDMFGDPVTNPKGWDKGTIRDLVVEAKYGSSKKADELNGEFPILRMNNITYQGNWDFGSLKYIDLDEKEQEKYLVNKGDMLFNRTNSKELVGKTAVYREETPMAYAGYLVRVRANEKANTEFISAYLNSDYCKEVLKNMCKNIVGMANINAQEMQDIKIYMPPIELQDRFAQIVYSVESMKKKNINSNEELNNLFNSLMQRAFNGEL